MAKSAAEVEVRGKRAINPRLGCRRFASITPVGLGDFVIRLPGVIIHLRDQFVRKQFLGALAVTKFSLYHNRDDITVDATTKTFTRLKTKDKGQRRRSLPGS